LRYTHDAYPLNSNQLTIGKAASKIRDQVYITVPVFQRASVKAIVATKGHSIYHEESVQV
jgi:hypothetical protein